VTADAAGLSPDAVPKRRLDARIRKTRGKKMVAGQTAAFELSETAEFVWSTIDGSRTVADIAHVVEQEYDIDYETALADVTDLLGTLTEGGILEY
jgi:hypothetical protein